MPQGEKTTEGVVFWYKMLNAALYKKITSAAWKPCTDRKICRWLLES